MKQEAYRFDRMELAGSLGDLGTLLPIAVGMVLVNELDPVGMFFAIGVYYILSGAYFRLTVPVQPMKVVGAYAVATAMPPEQILAAGLLLGLFLLVIGGTNLIGFVGRLIPRSVVRGVQLSTGILLMAEGVRFISGKAAFQIMRRAAEPYLQVQQIAGIPVGILIGIAGGLLTLLLLENRRFPAGLVTVLGGMLLGLLFGSRAGFADLRIGMYLPSFLPFGMPVKMDFVVALFALTLPQLPMTIGNAVVANADLSQEYFGDLSGRVTYRALTISMGMACLLSSLVGGMPLCHGAGGLAAHYRFGARTAGSNLIIGGIFTACAVFLGAQALFIIYLIPMAVLGVLLVFAGGQLALTIMDIGERKDLFVCLTVLGITLASNLAVGFMVGIVLHTLLRSRRLNV